MKLGKTGQGLGQGKQNVVLIVVLIVVILGAGFFVYRVMSGGGTNYSESVPETAIPPYPGGNLDNPIPPGPSSESTAPVSETPVEKPQPAPKESAPVATSSGSQFGMRQIKVFGTVVASYPATWKIKAGGANTCAIFTDGKAFFEVHAPDPKANSAKAIAESVLKKLAKGAVVINQGTDKISGYDAYWIAAKLNGRTVRIVGVDGPTRVALYEHVTGGEFSAYRDVFNKMQAEMKFKSN